MLSGFEESMHQVFVNLMLQWDWQHECIGTWTHQETTGDPSEGVVPKGFSPITIADIQCYTNGKPPVGTF